VWRVLAPSKSVGARAHILLPRPLRARAARETGSLHGEYSCACGAVHFFAVERLESKFILRKTLLKPLERAITQTQTAVIV
jgi:hypothetical protein